MSKEWLDLKFKQVHVTGGSHMLQHISRDFSFPQIKYPHFCSDSISTKDWQKSATALKTLRNPNYFISVMVGEMISEGSRKQFPFQASFRFSDYLKGRVSADAIKTALNVILTMLSNLPFFLRENRPRTQQTQGMEN